MQEYKGFIQIVKILYFQPANIKTGSEGLNRGLEVITAGHNDSVLFPPVDAHSFLTER